MNHAVPVAFVALFALVASACAGAHETQQRPATMAVPSSTLPPLAFPDSAFHSDEAESRPSSATSPSAPSRFETRRLGATDGDGGGETFASKRFHGAPVDLDLKSADLANVFRLLADVGHVNIVVDGEVSGTITLRLKHVPWDQALDLIARTHGLELHREGNVILVRARGPERLSSAAHDDRR